MILYSHSICARFQMLKSSLLILVLVVIVCFVNKVTIPYIPLPMPTHTNVRMIGVIRVNNERRLILFLLVFFFTILKNR